jgi:hypothetical protein
MKSIYIILITLLSLASILIKAQEHLQEDLSAIKIPKKPSISRYLQDLEKLGYCVIPQVLSTELSGNLGG